MTFGSHHVQSMGGECSVGGEGGERGSAAYD